MQNGPVLVVSATRTGFVEAFGEFRRALDLHPLGVRARYNCELVFEEIVTNIIRHGLTEDSQHRIRVSLNVSGDAIVLGFEDDGVPFDPRQARVAPSDLGGRGLLLVQRAARQIAYERTPDELNRLTVTIAA